MNYGAVSFIGGTWKGVNSNGDSKLFETAELAATFSDEPPIAKNIITDNSGVILGWIKELNPNKKPKIETAELALKFKVSASDLTKSWNEFKGLK